LCDTIFSSSSLRCSTNILLVEGELNSGEGERGKRTKGPGYAGRLPVAAFLLPLPLASSSSSGDLQLNFFSQLSFQLNSRPRPHYSHSWNNGIVVHFSQVSARGDWWTNLKVAIHFVKNWAHWHSSISVNLGRKLGN
jgi:hypothetical protein